MNTFTHRIHHRPQAARRGRSEGFTLVEVIITIVISSVLFMTIGTLFVTTQKTWLKGCAAVAAKDDYRVAEKWIDFTFRNSSGPFGWGDPDDPAHFGITPYIYIPDPQHIPDNRYSYALGWNPDTQKVGRRLNLPGPSGPRINLLNNVTTCHINVSQGRLLTINLTRWDPVERSSKTYTITSMCRNLRN